MRATATDQLANERTFLAYVRTALAFIGFGFVIARFALFMREFAIVQSHVVSGPGLSVAFGVIMVCMGIGIGAFGALRYVQQLRAFLAGRQSPLSESSAVAIVGIIAVFGGLMAYMLFRV